ncbi:MAG: NUDIX domain-containing protein [Spirochaetales bacterium]|nr:NUDIX domain-containing protein [Spirochaetales bacterium]
MEIEKKFLIPDLSSVPLQLDDFPSSEIFQGYISVDDAEVRIRRRDSDCSLTVKSAVAGRRDSAVRQEEETPLSSSDFNRLQKFTQNRIIQKRRYIIPYQDAARVTVWSHHKHYQNKPENLPLHDKIDDKKTAFVQDLQIELDVFSGKHDGLVIAEVEFSSQKAMEEFNPPEWFGRDVTDNPVFRNSSLACADLSPLREAEALQKDSLQKKKLQKDSSEPVYEQSGVLPYTYIDGKLHLYLITSQKKRRLIVPKGLVDPGFTAVEAAIREAYEEAGLVGHVTDSPIGGYQVKKWGGRCDITLYPMHVLEELEDWPEASFRQRICIPADPYVISERIDKTDLLEIILQFVNIRD